MHHFLRRVCTTRFFLLMTVAQAIVSCGPSTVQTTPITPVLPLSATQTSSIAGGTFALTLPPTQEIVSGTIVAPASPLGFSGATFVVTVQPAPASSLPSLPISSSALTRKPLGLANVGTVAAIIVTSSATIAFGAAPVFTLALPANSIVAGATYTLAYYDPITGWNLTWAGPATIVASTLTFASSGLPFALTANVPANFALLRSTATATPAPGPTAPPTQSPSPAAVSITPNSVALVIGGSPTSQTLSVAQSGFAPTFSPAMTCTLGANSLPGTVATIAAVGSSTASGPGASVVFSVALPALSPVAGTCTGSISSSAGGTAAPFTVTVTQTNAVIQSLDRR